MHDDSSRPPRPGRAGSGFDPDAVEAAVERLAGTALAALFEHVPATVWMTDANLTVTFVRGPFLKELQVSPDQLVGRALADLLVDGRGDHPLIQRHLTALEGTEASLRIEWGGRVYDTRVAPLRDAHGDVVGCVGVYHEVGWTSDLEGTLRESDIRLRRVVDSNMIGIAFGNAEGQITDANEAFLNLAGYTREDLVADGISWPALTPVEMHQRQMQALDEIRTRGRCDPFEVSLIRKDGRRVPVMVGGARLSTTRREGVAFVLDMSEHRTQVGRLESELAVADALSDAATLADALPELVTHLTGPLGWRAMGLWTVAPSGELTLAASHGLEDDLRPQLDALAARTRRGGLTRGSEAAQTVAAPLSADGVCYGTLVLVGRAAGLWDPDLVCICDRIAGRIAKLLARTR